jgi:putative transposase
MAEIRVFHEDRFLCRAVCAELAGASVPLRDILRVRNQRRRELRGVLRDRQSAVDTLLEMKRGEVMEKKNASAADRPAGKSTTTLKRYRNE